ncbi:MAG: Abi family protein [Tenericutes bacterium]|nr:Abi family protein [Mycoplasmatota bacterium]
MSAKIFKSLDEQIDILKSKGLVINEYDKTKEILLRENYFFLNGYRSPFLISGSKRFIEGTTFEEIHSLFTFDRYFRNIIFKNILIVENNYKSIFSYVLSKKYGYKEKDYLNVNNFDRSKEKVRQINDLLRKLKRQIRINGYQHQATSHYINNYGYIPMWVSVKVLSFGLMSELFTILKEEDKEEIAKYYDIECDALQDYLSVLANYRNLCAHEDILYNHETQKLILDTKYHKLLNIPKVEDDYIYGKQDIFALIIILKQVLTKDNFKMMMNEIDYEIDWLSSKLKVIDIHKVLYRMGFPDNYKEISYIE